MVALTRLTSTPRARLLSVLTLATAVALFIAFMPGHRGWFDVGVYHGTVHDWVHAGGDLYSYRRLGTQYGFTYPPFAAVAMLPMSLLGWHPTVVAHLALTALACGALLYWLVDPVAREHGWPRLFTFGIAACLFALLQPVRETVGFGQVNLLLAALVLADARMLATGSRPRGRGGRSPRHWAGVGIGLATAIKLTPAVFIGYLLLTRRWRAAAVAIGTAVAATLLAALILPGPSAVFWTEILGDTTRIGDLDYISNQSLRGVLARLDRSVPRTGPWLVLIAGVLALWAVRVRRAERSGDVWTGFALTGLVACLISPVTWVHHLVWATPALILLVAAALREPDRQRRRLLGWAAGGGYVILCSAMVWLWWPDHAGLGGIVGGSAYVWVTLALLAVLPPRTPASGAHPPPPDDHELVAGTHRRAVP